MEVTKIVHDEKLYLEIFSRQYQPLRELKFEHEKMGRQAWLNCYDSCAGLWLLTIYIGSVN